MSEGAEIERTTLDRDSLVVRHLGFDPLDAARLAQLSSLLDDGERAYAQRLRVASERDAYVVAHALARAVLRASGVEALSFEPLSLDAWRFAVGPHGKPRICAPEAARGVSFNLSHTAGMVAVAMTWEHPVGVDVERIEPGKLTLQLADQMFAPSERALCQAAPQTRVTDVLYDIWTLKEAYIKADGGGLAIPLDTFAFTLEPLSISFAPTRGDDPACWLFRTLRPAPSHALAFALRHPRPDAVRLDVQPVLLDQLLRKGT